MLISAPSIVGNEGEGVKVLADILRSLGFKSQLQHVECDRYNLICRVGESKPGRVLLLNGHIDTVPPGGGWSRDPFKPWISNDRLYGLGSCDMKAGLIALIHALRKFVEENPDFNGQIIYSAVVDEEGFSKGARKLVEEVNADAAIIAEPYFADESTPAVIGATGKVLLEVEVEGKASHAFRPWLGINAVEDAAKIVALIAKSKPIKSKKFGLIQPTVLKIEGGYKIYTVTIPDKCVFEVNRLTLPGESIDDVINWLHSLASKANIKSKIKISVKPPTYMGYEVNRNELIVKAFKRAYRKVLGVNPKIKCRATITDANVITGEAGIPSIVFGPKGGNAHMANEYVEIKTLMKAIEVYTEMMRAYFKYSSRAR